jgi:uncharacterized protein YyaL (SSP411 family)
MVVLHAAWCLVPQSLAETAQLAGRSEEETSALLAACRERLYEARQKRPHPHRDEKVRGRCCWPWGVEAAALGG